MTVQNRVATYIASFQAALSTLVAPVPTYAAFNPNYATQKQFITWFYRNIHQPVYTGSYALNKGNDTPKFDIYCHGAKLIDASTVVDTILQAWHGYAGMIGTVPVSKIDVQVLAHDYDEEASLHQVALALDFYIPVQSS